MKIVGYSVMGASAVVAAAIIYMQAVPDCFEGKARSIMEQAVAAKLKSPSTASFPSGGELIRIGDCHFNFSGPVDSQNSFGAIVRKRYSGVVTGEDYNVRDDLLAIY
jgi:hypothetical protein